MTGAGAERFGLSDRGIVAAGKRADLVMFDPDTISDSPLEGGAAGDDAGGRMRPRGIEQVYVNGKLVVSGGLANGEMSAGEVLRV